MTSTVKLSHEFIEEARIVSKTCNRSLSEQIEHWAKIGKLAEENPDLTYDVIKGLLIALREDEAGLRESYEFVLDE